MALAPGTRLGPYEVTALIGEGGMGQVYRATDTNLGRQVALKVLPDVFAHDPERLARFEREAKTLAALNHPNIAQIYGLEKADGVRALVMELVEGPTLADRIAQRPFPVDEALPIANQIAEALEAAHEQGIIHRDLKPANVKLRSDGIVKVLDFGLAKLADPSTSAAATPLLTNSPTITSPAATSLGVILGTAAYMSPEQAKGKKVDRRSDIWAFGCVLFEMLTGRRAFRGEEVSETLAEVIRGEPDWKALPAQTPAAVRRLLRRCFIKDPRQRLSDAAAVRLEIDEARTSEPHDLYGPHAVTSWRRFLPYAAVVATTAAVAGAAEWVMAPSAPPPQRPVRFAIDLPPVVQLANVPQRLGISGDGRRIAYSGLERGATQIYVRSLDQLDAIAIRGTQGLTSIFLSPDGEWVGYHEGGAFRKVPVGGGPSATICQVPAERGAVLGATWGTNGRIVFATLGARGLMQVPDAGGTPEALTSPPQDEVHRDPHFLPDGRHVLFVIEHTGQPDRIAVVSLDASEPRVLLEGNQPKFSSSGHLVFLREGALWATAFDAARLMVAGAPAPVLEGIEASPNIAMYDLAPNGALVYSPEDTGQASRTLSWVDRQGIEEAIPAPPRAYWSARASPDGTRIALDIRDQQNDIWVWDQRTRTLTRTTFDAAQDEAPVWAPDGRRIAFRSNRGGQFELFWRPADGTGMDEQLTTGTNLPTSTSFSPDGARLIFHHTGPSGTSDVLVLDSAGSRSTRPLLQSPFPEFYAELSPDGRWLAYQSQESGANQIVVRPFPDVQTGRWQLSTNGGRHPVWSRSGRELFYIGPDERLMSATIDTTGGFRFETPRTILARTYFEPIGVRAYDVSPDGKRFLMIKAAASAPEGGRAKVVVVLNWDQELKRLVPTP